jgi:hypothetical protein
MPEDRGFHLTAVHILMSRRDHASVSTGGIPVIATREQVDVASVDVVFLDDIGQDVSLSAYSLPCTCSWCWDR